VLEILADKKLEFGGVRIVSVRGPEDRAGIMRAFLIGTPSTAK